MKTIYLKLMLASALAAVVLQAQDRPPVLQEAEVRLTIVSAHPNKQRNAPAVAWLEPVTSAQPLSFVPKGHYTLMQKNRMFIPHLQVVPVGSVVEFPNADPYFHNVFSMFDGKRFDLGLYEAGSSKSVTFSHEGVSYIFCNIHPEMSAIIVTLATPLYAIANKNEEVVLRHVPQGDYRLSVWMEGVPLSVLSALTRQVHVSPGVTNLDRIVVPASKEAAPHPNEYGTPYNPPSDSSIY